MGLHDGHRHRQRKGNRHRKTHRLKPPPISCGPMGPKCVRWCPHMCAYMQTHTHMEVGVVGERVTARNESSCGDIVGGVSSRTLLQLPVQDGICGYVCASVWVSLCFLVLLSARGVRLWGAGSVLAPLACCVCECTCVCVHVQTWSHVLYMYACCDGMCVCVL